MTNRGKFISLTCLAIILVNLATGLARPQVDVADNTLICFSLLASAVMFNLILSHKKIRTFPFVFAVIFGLSGLAKIGISIFSDNPWRDNLFILMIVVVTLAEVSMIILGYVLWKTKKMEFHSQMD